MKLLSYYQNGITDFYEIKGPKKKVSLCYCKWE